MACQRDRDQAPEPRPRYGTNTPSNPSAFGLNTGVRCNVFKPAVPVPHIPHDLPGLDLSETLENEPSGLMERRLPIIVVVRLELAENTDADTEERTFTDNISAHGARVFSRQAWRPGDRLRVTPLNGDTACGQVVYCQ